MQCIKILDPSKKQERGGEGQNIWIQFHYPFFTPGKWQKKRRRKTKYFYLIWSWFQDPSKKLRTSMGRINYLDPIVLENLNSWKEKMDFFFILLTIILLFPGRMLFKMTFRNLKIQTTFLYTFFEFLVMIQCMF